MRDVFRSQRPNRRGEAPRRRVQARAVMGLAVVMLFSSVALSDPLDTGSGIADDPSPIAELESVESADATATNGSAPAGDELARVRRENAELRLSLSGLARSAETSRARLAEMQAEFEAVSEEKSALARQIAQLRQQQQVAAKAHTAQLTAAELRLREHKDRLGGVELRVKQLEHELAQREAEVQRLVAAQQHRTRSRSQLEERLEEIRARLPEPEGGSLTEDSARSRAEDDAQKLTRLLDQVRDINDPQLWQQIRETENDLHRSQFLLARAANARTVYRVRPGDSLARVSAFMYGDDEAWTGIYEANRHVLEDPDRVLPGMTLVIP